METGILEVDELTKRALEWLPQISEWSGPFSLVTIYAMLDNPIFDALYSAVIVYGDFGMYRLGQVRASLVVREKSLFQSTAMN